MKKFAGITAIAIGAGACVANSPSKNPEPIKVTTEEMGRKICKALGIGSHKTEAINVDCYDPQGFAVVQRDSEGMSFRVSLFDMPKTEQLTERQLETYIQDKRVVLAGELHNAVKDGKIFVRLIPSLKKAGFTHIGIEIDEFNQPMIERYYQSGDEKEAHDVLSHYGQDEELWRIVKTSKENGLYVVCFDYRPHEKHKQFPKNEWWQKWWTFRDEQMFLNVEKILKESAGKIAIFIGKGHVTSKSETDEIYGQDESGMPREIHTDKPLGHRLVKKYGKDNVGLIDFSGCTDTSPFTYACVKEEKEK